MFQPEEISVVALEANSIEIAKMIMTAQNENPFPETGTLGFLMGLAIALGNTAAIYATGQSRNQRRDFLRIVNGMVSDSYKAPFVSGTVFEEGTEH